MENDVVELDVYLSIVKYHFFFIITLYFGLESMVANISFYFNSCTFNGFLFEYIAKATK